MNNRIRIARGDNISAKTDTIEAGVPVYDTTKHIMRVGSGKVNETNIATTKPLSLEEGAILGTPGTPSGPSDTTKTRQVSDIFESGSNTVKNATNVTSTVSGSAKLGTTTGNTDTTDRQPDHIFETNSNTVKNASNVSSTINNIPISTIFESDGKTVKQVKCSYFNDDYFPFSWVDTGSTDITSLTWQTFLPGGQAPAVAAVSQYSIGTNFIVSTVILPTCPFTERGYLRIISKEGYSLSEWFGSIISVNVICSTSTLNNTGVFTYNAYPPVVTFSDTDGIYIRVNNAINSSDRTGYILTILSYKDN